MINPETINGMRKDTYWAEDIIFPAEEVRSWETEEEKNMKKQQLLTILNKKHELLK